MERKPLILFNKKITGKEVRKIESKLKNNEINVLTIQNCFMTNNKFYLSSIISGLKNNKSLIELNILNYSDNTNNLDTLNLLLKNVKKLKNLCIVNTMLTETHIEPLTKLTKLNKLVLNNTRIDSDLLQLVIDKIIKYNSNHLKTLILNNNYIQEKQLGSLFNNLSSSLTYLDISPISEDTQFKLDDQGWKHLNNFLKTRECKVEHLYLMHCNITDIGIELLCNEGLKTNKTVKCLDLSYNTITDKILVQFSELITHNNTLHYLNFSFGGVELTERGFNRFISGLKYNYSLNQVLFDISYMYGALYNKFLDKITEMISSDSRKTKLKIQHNLSKINKFFDLDLIFY